VVAYAQACGVELCIDATETQVRRPRAHRVGRRAFVSGKRRQNTIKTTTCSDHAGRTLWTGAVRPGRRHDQTRSRPRGSATCLASVPASRSASTRATGGRPRRSPAGPCPATQASQGRAGPGPGPLRAAAAPAVLPAHPRRARHRRAQAVAVAAALDRPPGLLRRDLPGRRWTGL
jgi:hypothetical protein